MNTQNLVLDVSKESTQTQVITIGQGDKAATRIHATIYDNGEALAGSGYTANFCMRLPGKADYFKASAGNVTDGAITYTVDEEHAAAKAGFTDECYFEILQGSTLIASTSRFAIRVLRAVEDGAELTPGWATDVQNAIDDAEDAAEEARQAAAAAHGIPTGGAAGQVLMKSSASDYAVQWADYQKSLSNVNIYEASNFTIGSGLRLRAQFGKIAFYSCGVFTTNALTAGTTYAFAWGLGVDAGLFVGRDGSGQFDADDKMFLFTPNKNIAAGGSFSGAIVICAS